MELMMVWTAYRRSGEAHVMHQEVQLQTAEPQRGEVAVGWGDSPILKKGEVVAG